VDRPSEGVWRWVGTVAPSNTCCTSDAQELPEESRRVPCCCRSTWRPSLRFLLGFACPFRLGLERMGSVPSILFAQGSMSDTCHVGSTFASIPLVAWSKEPRPSPVHVQGCAPASPRGVVYGSIPPNRPRGRHVARGGVPPNERTHIADKEAIDPKDARETKPSVTWRT